ncbi:MAG: hypothetical protein M1836_002717 [Candelina mexicana]|nr:MAG: hypothetical protein M1836_002717 [Candelina mexicana]
MSYAYPRSAVGGNGTISNDNTSASNQETNPVSIPTSHPFGQINDGNSVLVQNPATGYGIATVPTPNMPQQLPLGPGQGSTTSQQPPSTNTQQPSTTIHQPSPIAWSQSDANGAHAILQPPSGLYTAPSDEYSMDVYYNDTSQGTLSYEEQSAYTSSTAGSDSWTMVNTPSSGGFPASRRTSQGSWDLLSNSASMSPSESSSGVSYSAVSPQQSYTYSEPSHNTPEPAMNTMQAPEGFPPGMYKLIQDAGEGIYWLLDPAYRVYSHIPQTIMVSSRYLSPSPLQPNNPHAADPPTLPHSSNKANQFVCLWQCSTKGKFKRKADLQRHYDTCHVEHPAVWDCTMPKCGRTGLNGFSRKDHMWEHLRQYHHVDVARRTEGGYGQRKRRS